MFKPAVPEHISSLIKSYTKTKTPHFFIYAKDKEIKNVEPKNGSVVNRLDDIILNKRMHFSKKNFGKLDYKLLMSNKHILIDSKVIEAYIKLNRKYHFKINNKDNEHSNIHYIAKEIKDELANFGSTEDEICDMLVKYLYGMKDSKSKEALWLCYGSRIVDNLRQNIGDKTKACHRCGQRFEPSTSLQVYCPECHGYQKKGKKRVVCIDCRKRFEVAATNMKKIRCDDCQKKFRKLWDRQRKKKK